MANELIKIEAPDYMLAVLKDHPELEGLIGELSAGTSSGPAYPQIKLKGTRFRIVDGDIDQILKTTEITVAILRAKKKPERIFYLKPYVEGEEHSPDCQSADGITPDEGVVCRQNPNCEGCAQNAWGTGKNADGTPSKGKACKERKLIVVAPVGPEGVLTDKAFGMSIPPTSLTPYDDYIDQLKLHGVKIPGLVVTTIGFADANHPILSFRYSGALKPAEAAKAIKLMTSNEVANIIAVPGSKAVTPPPPAPPVEPEPAPEPAVIPPTEETKKRGRKPKTETTAFGETTAAEPESAKEEVQQDLPDPAAVAKALGIPGFE